MFRDKLLISFFIAILLLLGNNVFAETIKQDETQNNNVQTLKDKPTEASNSINKDNELQSYIQEGYEDVQKTFDKLIIGYSNRQLDQIMALIADDEHAVFFGTGARYIIVGKENLRKAFENDFNSIKNIRINVPWISISGKDNIAWLNAIIGFSCNINGEIKQVNARQTIVFEKIEDEWKIVNSHLSFPAMEIIKPPVQKPAPKAKTYKHK